MPELPEVEALAAFLRARAVGRTVARVDVVGIQVLKTYDPPPTALAGLQVTGAVRRGKFLDLDVDGLHLVVHLARAGWLQWKESLPPAPPRPGKGPIGLRVHLDDGSGFDLTEQGTQKRLAVYVVRDPALVPGVARLGIDPLDPAFTPEVLAGLLAGVRGQVKGVLTDQSVLAGVGNAYSDEVLWEMRMSPFKSAASLTPADVSRLHGGARRHAARGRRAGRGAGREGAQGREEERAATCTAAPACRARAAATPCGRCPSRPRPCSTARPARRAASRWPTGG